ncbi:acyl carrier protein [Allokutzneria albata]|uniref:Acyl carrier protein n=1 Tax=Allokutzneria albata TaxID=211114 RepID=A0A1G9U990_ALLAB|nr:acyl carrier protein [Allokutzneria albata]SDM56566.1 Acyl carrier protein [Allokutzneria albata]
MDQERIIALLKDFLEREVLRAPDSGLRADTPLLEWGVLNSLTMVKLVAFVKEELDVRIPPERIVGADFKDLASIARLVDEIAGAAPR